MLFPGHRLDRVSPMYSWEKGDPCYRPLVWGADDRDHDIAPARCRFPRPMGKGPAYGAPVSL